MDNGISLEMPGIYEKAVDQVNFRKSTGCIREYRDPEDRDQRAGDGIVSYGQRVVAKDGSIRFAGGKWKHEKLKALAGFTIGAVVDDYWVGSITLYWPSYPSGKAMFRLHAH
jgi:hypothetical protein